MASTLTLSPWARAALPAPVLRAVELGANQLKANVSAVGSSDRGPWSVTVTTKNQVVEHRGYDLEGTAFEALERFALGVDTRTATWRAGSDGLGHGHAMKRSIWTLCLRPAVDERFGYTERSRCRACLRAMAGDRAAVA